MIAQYTEVFEDYLRTHDIEGVENYFTLTIKPKFNYFPTFSLVEDFNISFYEIFKERYDLREIGAETEELFEHYLNETINEAITKFIPKINIFIANFNELFSRKVKLEEQGENKFYLNPVNNTVTSNKQQSASRYDGSREHVYGYFKSNPEIMEGILKLRDIYNEAVDYFDKVFMSVL